MTTILSIGTTHPWNIAGVGLDLLAGAELGVRTVTAVTAVSAQDRHGLHGVQTLESDIVRAQLAAARELHIDAVRVGAVTSADMVSVVAGELRHYYDRPVVVDPVIAPSSGGAFADPQTVLAIRSEIGALPNVILTPNLAEAQTLLGDGRSIDRDTIAQAARDVLRFGVRAVLLKGGHLHDNPVDALATVDGVELFGDSRIDGELRGTGCLLAMSLACALGRAEPLRDAVRFARAFVRRKFASRREFGGLPVAY